MLGGVLIAKHSATRIHRHLPVKRLDRCRIPRAGSKIAISALALLKAKIDAFKWWIAQANEAAKIERLEESVHLGR